MSCFLIRFSCNVLNYVKKKKEKTGNANHAGHGNALQFLFVSMLQEIIWVCIYVDCVVLGAGMVQL